ncbi:hypothetical protein [Bradyrhizobium sp. JR3.5]
MALLMTKLSRSPTGAYVARKAIPKDVRSEYASRYGMAWEEKFYLEPTVGTPDYSKCLESLYLQDQQLAAAEEANRQARIHEFGQRLQRASEAMQSANPPMVHCSTMPNGIGGTNTTCNQ